MLPLPHQLLVLRMRRYERNVSVFKRVMVESSLMGIVCSLLYAVHRYLKERLALLWREKLTKQLHRDYFNKMSYYKLSHLNEQQINDVEERIVKDPRRFTKGLAAEMEKFSAALTSGVWFTYKLYSMSTLVYSVSPLIYFFAAAQVRTNAHYCLSEGPHASLSEPACFLVAMALVRQSRRGKAKQSPCRPQVATSFRASVPDDRCPCSWHPISPASGKRCWTYSRSTSELTLGSRVTPKRFLRT